MNNQPNLLPNKKGLWFNVASISIIILSYLSIIFDFLPGMLIGVLLFFSLGFSIFGYKNSFEKTGRTLSLILIISNILFILYFSFFILLESILI